MINKKHLFHFVKTVPGSLLLFFITACFGQAEVQPWGNLEGIRIEGQLMNFQSSLVIVNEDWSAMTSTGRERQRPKYHRELNKQIVNTRMDSFYFVQQVEDMSKGLAHVNLEVRSGKDSSIAGIYFLLKLAAGDYGGNLELLDPNKKPMGKLNFSGEKDSLTITTSGIRLSSSKKELAVFFEQPTEVVMKKSADKTGEFIDLYIAILSGAVEKDQTAEKNFSIQVSGEVDRKPVTLQINDKDTGRVFAGFGGNFRLQNPKGDPQVIDYCLQNMRVAWGRVEMPFQFWQPSLDADPIALAKEGKLANHVRESMEMAQRLNKKGMPIILTAWSAPRWAITGDISYGPRHNGIWGNQLDTNHTMAIYKSIADYIVYLKEQYGTEVSLFSFNESDLGINVRQTGEEHAKLIKGLGAYFVSRGLKTKMLLGDNSDATTWSFIYPAMQDPETYPFIGAISFHSWRGWETETLMKWTEASEKMKRPLIVGEGSIDAAAWNYPMIFQEQTYALEEINLYVRLLAICHPLTILQWQLTSDYSPLSGGGLYGDNGPLKPTQRFWNLKQFSDIPADVHAIDSKIDGPFISCAAEKNMEKGIYVVHLVNNGATRKATIKGFPAGVKKLIIHTTSKDKNMLEGKPVRVVDGKASIVLDEVSYTTLVSE